MLVFSLLSALPVWAMYAPEINLPEERKAAVRKASAALKSLPRDVRESYIAEKMGLCFLPNGGSAYMRQSSDSKSYYAYTPSLFVGSDGKEYGLRDTQKKTESRARDAEAVKTALAVINTGSAEAVFAELAKEVTQMCNQTVKNRLKIMPQALRDCFLAELSRLVYLPGGKSAYTGKIASSRAPGSDVDIRHEVVCEGAKFVDSQGVEHGFHDVLEQQRDSRDLYRDAWALAALCKELVGVEEILLLYAEEVEAMRKYRKSIAAGATPVVDKKEGSTQPRSPEANRCISAMRSMPKPMREAYLAEKMGFCYNHLGTPAYEDKWVITTREGIRVRHYPVRTDSRFMSSNGKECGYAESLKKSSSKQGSDRLNKLAAEVMRGLFGGSEDAVIDAFSKDINEMAVRTAKNRLSSMPPVMRAAFFAEEAEMVFLPGGASGYTGKVGTWRVLGCRREASWNIVAPDARFIDAAGREHDITQVVQKEWRAHGQAWLLARWCTRVAGKEAVLGLFSAEISAMRKHYEAVKAK